MMEGQAASAGSPSQSAGATAAQSDWEAQKREYERQIRATADERNRFKQQADAWMKLGQEAGDAVRYDPVTQLPVGWNIEDKPSSSPTYAQVVNPFGELSGVDANQANAWLQGQLQSYVSQQGYVTQSQAQALANQAAAQAYQAANHRFSTSRAVDKLLSDPNYKELGDPNSEWAKRTSAYLQNYQAGRPSREGAGWDEWEYTGPLVLHQAADITYAQMVREGGAAKASQDQAIQNQQAAGLANAVPGVAGQQNPLQEFEKVIQSGGNPLDFLKETVDKAAALGIKQF